MLNKVASKKKEEKTTVKLNFLHTTRVPSV